MPDQSSFQLEVNQQAGKPWKYEKLVSPFDFPLHKSAEELEAEKEEIFKRKKIYFFRNSSLTDKSVYAGFLNRLSSGSKRNVCARLLDSLFNRGIIESSEITEGKQKNFTIYLLEGNFQRECVLSDFFTLSEADNFVGKSLEQILEPERQRLRDSIRSFFTVSVFYHRDRSEKLLREELNNVLPTRGMVMKGQTIIDNGELVTPEKIVMMNSLRKEMNLSDKKIVGEANLLLVGQTITVLLVLSMMMFYLYFFRKLIFSQNSEITFIFILITLSAVLSGKVSGKSSDYLYFVPFTIAPILIRTFFDTRTSLFTHLNIIIIGSFFASDKFAFIFIQLLAGIGAIFSVAAVSRRSQLFASIVAVFITYALAYLALKLSQSFFDFNFQLSELTPFVFSSATVIFAYPLIFISEKTFGFISDFTLLELSGSNSVLMRELASVAPGTFQHSLQVASLAEEAIFKVGGNPLLVRAGALHHDIGKIKNPRFFIENKMGDMNPHEDLPPQESAEIIIQHVIDGIELAKTHKLPEQIIDFIRTHHGTTYTRYFLHRHQSEHSGEFFDESKFRYPGPIPYSKETAVLMMADSVEAASRSLKVYDAPNIDQLVDRVINSQIAENQFLNSDITFRDINNIKKIFKRRLMNIYHVRIEYPR